MIEQLGRPVTIPEIARACRLSVSHFKRAFSNTVGVSPYNWFLLARVERAKFLLSETAMSLAEIALECGFVDQSHFTNTFVRKTGNTPYRWRRNACGSMMFGGGRYIA
ncbi:helix-turn-helix domain-containing protein [Sphingobium nicotianae]|uniref:AraC family transcriptional regulator n=1 Tax=Sphingobium nicotianae TaxID=2782607 RepID=A0A9X1D9U8_9SPHN|nr:AraC family transcriptional regulator [Sphingobium nicotianae]MBT2186021.1 AraC family transcriptional regulator [Sphingobium nicotianae]